MKKNRLVNLIVIVLLAAGLHAGEPVLRGFNLSMYSPETGELTEADFIRMREIGATLIRLDFSKNYLMAKEPPYLFNEDNFDRLHKYIGWAEKTGLKVIIDPHSFPGTILPWTIMGHDRFWFAEQYKTLVIQLWSRIARECNGYGDVIWAYDLINEPHGRAQQPGQIWDLNDIYKELIQEIRQYDQTHSIMLMFHMRDFESYAQGPEFYEDPAEKLIYSPHFYWPQKYTHQGLSAEVAGTRAGKKYPDAEKGWTLEGVDEALQTAVRFKNKHNVDVFFGEFSCNYDEGTCWDKNDRFNPHPELGGDQWLTDVVSLFEKYKFHWTYHCYEDWEGWDATVPHPRWVLIQRFFDQDGPLHPSIEIIQPQDNAAFKPGQTIHIKADARDEDGEIQSVVFYAGDVKLGEDHEAPYEVSWQVPAGSHRIHARVIDDSGADEEARPVDIAVQPNLPAPWKNQDLGGTAAPGCAWMEDEIFTVLAAEDNLYTPGQGCHYVYQETGGSVTLTARLLSQSSTVRNNGAGLMIRCGLSREDGFAELIYTDNRTLQFRGGTESDLMTAMAGRPETGPLWLKLKVSDAVVKAAWSSDGKAWKALGQPLCLNFKGALTAGLVVRAHKDVFMNKAQFDSIKICE